jgi:hypothetical protein
MPTLRLINLHCNQTEDDTGGDETFIIVKAKDFHKFGVNPMNNGDDWSLNEQVPFSRRAIIEVWDEDLGHWPDQHDLLGSKTVNADDIGEGQAFFTNYSADYTLSYEVIADG